MSVKPNVPDKFEKLREQAEELLKHKPHVSDKSSTNMVELINELNMHQAELEIQNEELKRAQQELSLLEQEYEDLYEFAPCGYLTLNARGLITRANLKAVSLLGIPRGKLLGSGFGNYIDSAWNDTWYGARADAAKSGQKQTLELQLKNTSDSRNWVHADVVVERDADQSVKEWKVVLFDINERKKVEAEKEKLQGRMAQVQRMESVGRLAGGVAHDFNNMLNVIIGHTELAKEDLPEDHHLQDDFAEIHKAARRSADLTRQLLAFASRQIVSPKVIDLNHTIQNMLRMLGGLIRENIKLVWKPAENMPTVRIDPSQLDQVLTNLVMNTRDAISNDGTIVIETGRAQFDENDCEQNSGFLPGAFVMLSITDNGRGMDEDTKAHIFEPFYTTKNFGEGFGLGLATVYGIVNQNDGFINVLSKPGKGTTFQIFFPEHSRPIVRQEDTIQPESPLERGDETILIVEDEPAILNLARDMLGRLGYQVLSAISGEDAFLQVEKYKGTIDLLVADVIMPVLNGAELAEQMTTLQPGLKQLFISGYAADIIAEHGVKKASKNILYKPFTFKELAAAVRRVLDGK